jgi:hypothetical protein
MMTGYCRIMDTGFFYITQMVNEQTSEIYRTALILYYAHFEALIQSTNL